MYTGGHSPVMIKFRLFPTFQVITYRAMGALTLTTVATKNEMRVISWHFFDNYVFQYIPMG